MGHAACFAAARPRTPREPDLAGGAAAPLHRLLRPRAGGIARSGRARVLAETATLPTACELRHYEITMVAPRLIAADRVLGWSGWDFELPDTPLRMWRRNTAEDPGECVAAGHLIPWGI